MYCLTPCCGHIWSESQEILYQERSWDFPGGAMDGTTCQCRGSQVQSLVQEDSYISKQLGPCATTTGARTPRAYTPQKGSPHTPFSSTWVTYWFAHKSIFPFSLQTISQISLTLFYDWFKQWEVLAVIEGEKKMPKLHFLFLPNYLTELPKSFPINVHLI